MADSIRTPSGGLALETATVEYDPQRTDPQAMAAAVERAGYRLVLPSSSEDIADAEAEARGQEAARQRRELLVGLFFATPLFVLSMARDFALLGPWAHAAWVNWLFWALATPVQFYSGLSY